MKATKILKTVKNVSWATQKVRNSDWKKVDIANNGTFTTYKWKCLLRLYSNLFTIVSDEDPETPVYKITAVSDSVVTIEDKHWFEVISMKVETEWTWDDAVSTFYLWIGWTWKADSDKDIIDLVTEMIESVVAWDNIVTQEDANTLVTEYNSLD